MLITPIFVRRAPGLDADGVEAYEISRGDERRTLLVEVQLLRFAEIVPPFSADLFVRREAERAFQSA